MTDLIEKLKEIAIRANDSDASFIKRAIDRIEELEAELTGHKEDTTDWRASVEKQMRRRRDDKWIRSRDRWRRYWLKFNWHSREVSSGSTIAVEAMSLGVCFLQSWCSSSHSRRQSSTICGPSIFRFQYEKCPFLNPRYWLYTKRGRFSSSQLIDPKNKRLLLLSDALARWQSLVWTGLLVRYHRDWKGIFINMKQRNEWANRASASRFTCTARTN